MAGGPHDKETVKYVGDSRVRATRERLLPKPYSEYPGKTEPFFPNFLLKEWMAAVVFLIGFMVLVVSHPAPLESHAADPNDTSYIPLPDWYFLFLYQLLKKIPGDMIVLGTVVIPGFFSLLFLLAPWLDRSPERRPWKRPIATTIMLFVIASIVYLTYEAVAQHKMQLEESASAAEQAPAPPPAPAPTESAAFDPEQAYMQSCSACHGQDLKGTPAAPSLIGLSLSTDEVVDIMTNGIGVMPAGRFQGTDEQKKQLAEWVLSHQ